MRMLLQTACLVLAFSQLGTSEEEPVPGPDKVGFPRDLLPPLDERQDEPNDRREKPRPEWLAAIDRKEWRDEWIAGRKPKEESEFYYEAWQRITKTNALEAEARGKQLDAAIAILEALQARSPDWKPQMLRARLKMAREESERLKR